MYPPDSLRGNLAEGEAMNQIRKTTPQPSTEGDVSSFLEKVKTMAVGAAKGESAAG
jgi:hypothetical protein